MGISRCILTSLVLVAAASGILALSVPSSSQNQVDPTDSKVWLFAVDGRKSPYYFLDSNGTLVGFDVDLIRAVCAIAGKTCQMVLSEFTQCTYTHREINYAGPGLMSGQFDACPGYAITVDRQGGFDFTDPYLYTSATFTVSPGNPKGFDPTATDYSAFTLSHLTGAPTNGMCLNRLDRKFDKIIIAADLPDAKGLLLNGTADALFSPRTNITGLEVLPEVFHCDLGGAGIMVKKGSTLPQWWNPAFKIFKILGGYSALCASASVKYNYPVRCLSQAPNSITPTQREVRAGSPLYFQAASDQL